MHMTVIDAKQYAVFYDNITVKQTANFNCKCSQIVKHMKNCYASKYDTVMILHCSHVCLHLFARLAHLVVHQIHLRWKLTIEIDFNCKVQITLWTQSTTHSLNFKSTNHSITSSNYQDKYCLQCSYKKLSCCRKAVCTPLYLKFC